MAVIETCDTYNRALDPNMDGWVELRALAQYPLLLYVLKTLSCVPIKYMKVQSCPTVKLGKWF